MKYAFKLEWEELDEELKGEKIDEYVNNTDCDGEEAEKRIKAHFPIYF